jgi:hypothetical protein
MGLWMVMISKSKVPTALVKKLGKLAIERRLSLQCNQGANASVFVSSQSTNERSDKE